MSEMLGLRGQQMLLFSIEAPDGLLVGYVLNETVSHDLHEQHLLGQRFPIKEVAGSRHTLEFEVYGMSSDPELERDLVAVLKAHHAARLLRGSK